MTPYKTEQYRNECEARHVLAMPTLEERRTYLSAVEKRRGKQSRKYLESEILRQHRMRKPV